MPLFVLSRRKVVLSNFYVVLVFVWREKVCLVFVKFVQAFNLINWSKFSCSQYGEQLLLLLQSLTFESC